MNSTREMLTPNDPRQATLTRLRREALALVDLICGDTATQEGLLALTEQGATVEVRIALPQGRIGVELLRDGKRETLALIGPVPLRTVN